MQTKPTWKWPFKLLASWRRHDYKPRSCSPTCFCKNSLVDDIGEDHLGVRLLKAEDFEAFATSLAMPGCPLQRPGSVQALAIRTIHGVAQDTLKNVAATLVVVQELRLVGLSRDCVETVLSVIPAGTSIQYMATTYLPRQSFPCSATVKAFETWDDLCHRGDGFLSLAHLKLHEQSWHAVAASLETFVVSAQLVSLCVAFTNCTPERYPVRFNTSLPNLQYLEVDEARSMVRRATHSATCTQRLI